MEPAGFWTTITIARNVITDRCERCGYVILLSLVKDGKGRTMLWCNRCISAARIEGFVDHLQHFKVQKSD